MDRDRRQRILRRLGRGLRRAAKILAWTLAALALVVALVLALPASRKLLLDSGLDRAGALLPGELTIGESGWPGLGRIVLHDVVWHDGNTELAAVDTLHLDLRTRDLLRRDVTLNAILLAGVRADVPAIQQRLPATASTSPATDAASAEASGPPPFPRPGALPPLPSVAVGDLTVRRVAVHLADTRTARLDTLSLAVELRRDHAPHVTLGISARPLSDIGAAWRLDGGIDGDSLQLALAPLVVESTQQPPPFADLATSGAFTIRRTELDHLLAGDLDWPHLQLQDLVLAGDLGRWQVDLDVNGREPGELALHSALPAAPAALLHGLAIAGLDTLAPGSLDTLQRHWGRQATPGLDLRVTFTPPEPGEPLLAAQAEAHGDLVLPAPRSLAPLLPPQLLVDDLGPIFAAIDGAVDARRDPLAARLRVDLGRTDWLEAAVLDVSGDTTAVTLDTLAVTLPGLALRAQGRAGRDSVDLAATLDVPDARLAARWRDPALASLEASAHVDVVLRGAWPLPDLDLDATASATLPTATVPDVRLRATAGRDTVDLLLDLPRGASFGEQTVESSRVAFAGALTDQRDRLHGRLDLGARTPDLALGLAGTLQTHGLSTGTPAGTLGVDSLHVQLRDRDLGSTAPWRLAFDAADSSLSVEGLHLAGELGELHLEATAAPDTLASTLDLALKIALSDLAPLLPDQARTMLPEATLVTGASLAVAGTPQDPWAAGDVNLGFRDRDQLEPLSARVALAVAGRGAEPAGLSAPPVAFRPGAARARITLAYADTSLVRLGLRAPLPRPGAPADTVLLTLDADRTELARLQPLLPPGVSLEGRFSADTRIAGTAAPGQLATAPPDLRLGGGFALDELRVSLPDGSWLAFDGSVELDGTTLEPVIGGGLDLDAGLIRVPDPPPSLLPASGEAMLWQATAASDTSASAPDTTAAPSQLEILPELEFTVTSPGNLWLRGQGLDVELAGDLVLRLREGQPVLEGQLEAVQGTMRQLGHVFTLEEGRITFYADETELDPQLDLVLGVRIQEYAIDVVLRGTANEPDLAFRSEPPLEDGDIMSLLLFGRTAEGLNQGQVGFLAERAGELAAAYGSVQLQESLARELGVDVLTIAPGSGGDDATSLTVGKYLSADVLVRYEQVLEEASAFYVHLDYRFWRRFKLHTQMSQGQASGAELKWERDW